MISAGAPKNTTVVIAGLSNTYADYITTYEEYQVCRPCHYSQIDLNNTLLTFQTEEPQLICTTNLVRLMYYIVLRLIW